MEDIKINTKKYYNALNINSNLKKSNALNKLFILSVIINLVPLSNASKTLKIKNNAIT